MCIAVSLVSLYRCIAVYVSQVVDKGTVDAIACG